MRITDYKILQTQKDIQIGDEETLERCEPITEGIQRGWKTAGLDEPRSTCGVS